MMRQVCLLFMVCLLPLSAQWRVMPLPASIASSGGGSLPAGALTIAVTGAGDARLDAAVNRLRARLGPKTGPAARLLIKISRSGESVQQPREDESYRLEISKSEATLTADNALGAMHGLETFLQLVDNGAVPAVTIEDHPRFPWRGLHLDVARHFMPMEVIKRNLDGMAAVKLNVFHWHLSDDQGFRVESKRFPKLQQNGSDGLFYTQGQIREIVAYARDRGIRVVPEFDIPGHATSWLAGYPELSAGPGPFQIIRKWGIFDPTFDPSNPKVYEFLDGFIGEMAPLFPDPYFHIGGDEVNGKQWSANTGTIPAFMKTHDLRSNASLHNYFNQQVQKIVSKHGKRMEGWDEILNDALPREIVIQSWRGQKSLFDAARQGFSGVLSAGYYLDHMEPAAKMYQVDPLDEKGRATGMLNEPQTNKVSSAVPLTESERAHILGGEVCMWTEYVSPETVDSRIWPRTAAVAERLWSPASVKNEADMYRRLDLVSAFLDRLGLTHNAHYTAMLERLAGTKNIGPLKALADVVNPGDLGLRHRMKRDYTQQTPLDRFVDAARPDSPVVRRFGELTERYLANRSDAAARAEIFRSLETWAGNDAKLRPMIAGRPALTEVGPLSAHLSALARLALRGEGDRAEVVRNARQPVAEVRLAITDPIEKLIGNLQ